MYHISYHITYTHIYIYILYHIIYHIPPYLPCDIPIFCRRSTHVLHLFSGTKATVAVAAGHGQPVGCGALTSDSGWID